MTVKMENRSIEEKILLGVTAAAIFILSPFLIKSILEYNKLRILVDLVAVGGISIIFIGVWFTSKVKLFSGLFAIIAHVNILFGIYIVGSDLIFWLFPIIIASFYLLPTVIACVLNGLLISIAGVLTYQHFEHFSLPLIMASFVVTGIFSLIFSIFMQRKNRQLLEKDKINQLRNNILELIASSSKLSKVLSAVVEGIENELPGTMCSISLVDDTGSQLRLAAGPSLPEFYKEAVDVIPIAKGVGSCGEAASLGKRVLVTDIATHPNWAPWAKLAHKAQLVSCWSEPIISHHGTTIGTIAIYFKTLATPTENEFDLVEQFVNLTRIAIERDKADTIIWHQANFDNLTQLPNRHLLHEHLSIAIDNAERDKKQLVIAMLDLDNFKDVNDSLGHAAGDRVLIECASRIKNSIRKNDIVARLGGDEFIIAFVGTTSAEDIDKIGQKLLTTLAQPYVIEHKNFYCTASIGLACYPNDGLTIDALMTNADQAMYLAKTRGRNSIHYFTENMSTDFLKRMELIDDLRTAVEQKQFHLVYQPIVDLHTHRIAKAEALIRWQHPQKGLISPMEFIPIAEEIGLIVEISEWIFTQVSQQVHEWRQRHCADLSISINTSPVQYRNEGKLVKAWADSLLAQGIPYEAISIEITEHLLMDNQVEVVEALETLRQQGITISIDDFGTGYCSFSYLKNFAFDYLKIDQSFVQNMSIDNNDAALCEAIIVMAGKLNMQVIAEGIETEEQKQLLIDAGCTLGQGYLLAKPLSVMDFEQLLIKQNQSGSTT
ncbi:putative bifunctional diguanylate cyclase/phosphodiesterase [Shewanella algicola]|uniref:putative bifunctional diguanylate cyclase/phosphodiesterase n=1 Tax=Shewanella algicola TaxID=640633 RepID=UPI002495321A|nr:EAL domain-containing protein [Shewanella algicola]